MTRRILLHISDPHAGHEVGLCSPNITIDKFGGATRQVIALNEFQRYLWYDLYLTAIDLAVDRAGGDEIIPFWTGDLTHGGKHPEGLVSTRESDQVDIAVANAKPLTIIPGVKVMRFALGTAAHGGGEGSLEIQVVKRLKAEHPDIDIAYTMHGLADIDGLLVDYAHHGPGPGSREWLKGNVPRYYLRDIVFAETMRGAEPPALVLRGHVHDPIWETVRTWRGDRLDQAHIIISPPLCGMTFWAQGQALKSKHLLRVGITIIEIEDGRVIDVLPVVKTIDLRSQEVIG